MWELIETVYDMFVNCLHIFYKFYNLYENNLTLFYFLICYRNNLNMITYKIYIYA